MQVMEHTDHWKHLVEIKFLDNSPMLSAFRCYQNSSPHFRQNKKVLLSIFPQLEANDAIGFLYHGTKFVEGIRIALPMK
jgi:hypothetical protein